MRFNSRNQAVPGVTFLEIMLTIFMMGMILSSAFVAQSTVLQQISQWSRSLRSIFKLRELIVHTTQDRLENHTHPKEQQKGPVKLIYTLERPKKGSALAKFEDLYIEQVTSQWLGDEETMVSLLYKPEVKKK